MVMTNPCLNATIERHPENTDWCRLTWDGFNNERMFADFDPCPVRGLTAEQSAREWARSVLGQELEPSVLT